MSEGVSFQTRARTIDHLGRGQIADAPTAISELWKNAYDAYAQNVALHIFSGSPEVAAIFDDGVGMDRADILQRWLVIGTESKIEDIEPSSKDRFGLPLRRKQGEKGIGRLSAAFLSPATALVSRKAGGKFVAVLIDWRLFENPFIALDDVKLPVEQFDTAEEVVDGLAAMAPTITLNLGVGHDERSKRLAAAWARYSKYEKENSLPSTATAISEAWKLLPLKSRHLEEWPAFMGLSDHGTAMFMMGIHHELNLWVRPDIQTDEAEGVKRHLRETLTGFTDPYAEQRAAFDYEVWYHVEGGRNERVVGANDVFGTDDLHGLEHYVEGEFDASGTFMGRVVAFGQDLGIKQFVPRQPPPRTGRDRLGPFKFCIGTFEQDLRRSTHSEQQHARLVGQAEFYGGVMVYRDDLRVMPYGREDADFLGIEARRGRHAGRYFWAHRRSFGRIAFTRENNPNLRDKAGREGLVDNRARRELRQIVEQLLIEFAAVYFGTDSSFRQELLPEIMARNAAAKAAAQKARTSRRRGIRQFLKTQSGVLDEALQRLDGIAALARSAKQTKDKVEVTVMASRLKEMLAARDGLRPPVVSAKLGDLEGDYRSYRDNYQTFTTKLEKVSKLASEVEGVVGGVSPKEAFHQSFASQEGILLQRLAHYNRSIEEQLSALKRKWLETIETDKEKYRHKFGHYLSEKVKSENLPSLLNLLDAARAETEEELAGNYLPFLQALQQLIDGVDLESAFASTEDERADLEERLRDLQTVAQVGVTVEIIGHELESLEAEVKRNLNKLPTSAKATPAFHMAMNSHLALADRLRFLSPMKVGGYRAREAITGAQIADYVFEFFARILKDQRIEFSTSKAFRSIRITDIPARIYPVFLNLINNAIYWVSQSSDRQIRLDFIDGKVIIADSGPGVDQDDVPKLFELFFTRRKFGRGVGLYLSRANLGVANHKIRYATDGDPKILDGANFVIEFRGVTSDG